jgi:IS5 family transposase
LNRYEGTFAVTSASVHDSQKLDDLLDPENTASTVWADSAYRSKEAEEKLAGRGFRSRIHRRGCRGKPLTARQEDLTRQEEHSLNNYMRPSRVIMTLRKLQNFGT